MSTRSQIPPHDGQPLLGPAVWRGRYLADQDVWKYRLSDREIGDLSAGVATAEATGKPLTELERIDFPFSVLRRAIDGWLAALHRGRGFVLVRGVPVNRYSLEEASLAYWGLGLHMGTAVTQSLEGELLGTVRDRGADPADPSVRLYKTREALGFHRDGSDVVGLLCLNSGKSGGRSSIVSSATVFNEILRRCPDLVPLLYEPFHFDRNEEQRPGEPPFFSAPLLHRQDDEFRFFYIGWYVRKAQRHPEVPRLTPAQLALLDLIDEIAEDPEFNLSMDFQPGDIQWLKNSTILHSRTAYEDGPEPDGKRHLLRLWLSR